MRSIRLRINEQFFSQVHSTRSIIQLEQVVRGGRHNASDYMWYAPVL